MKIRNSIYILLACFAGTFLRIIINDNFIVSILGSLFFGFVIANRLNYSTKKIMLSGFCACFTSFSGFIYFLYNIFNQGGWINFLIYLNLIIIINLLTMYFGFWIGRKIT